MCCTYCGLGMPVDRLASSAIGLGELAKEAISACAIFGLPREARGHAQ